MVGRVVAFAVCACRAVRRSSILVESPFAAETLDPAIRREPVFLPNTLPNQKRRLTWFSVDRCGYKRRFRLAGNSLHRGGFLAFRGALWTAVECLLQRMVHPGRDRLGVGQDVP